MPSATGRLAGSPLRVLRTQVLAGLFFKSDLRPLNCSLCEQFSGLATKPDQNGQIWSIWSFWSDLVILAKSWSDLVKSGFGLALGCQFWSGLTKPDRFGQVLAILVNSGQNGYFGQVGQIDWFALQVLGKTGRFGQIRSNGRIA